MKLKTYRLTPTDLLFFRDGRPMAAGEGIGHGARWPLPPVFFDALHAALHRAFPEKQTWEETHSGHTKNGRGREGEQRFGTLRTVGPFPCRDSEWLFPAPLDARLDKESAQARSLLPLGDERNKANDLPDPLKYALGNPSAPGKEEVPRWWTASDWRTYLETGALPLDGESTNADSLFDPEPTTGIGTDPATGTQDGERIYSAEYLRLREGVSLACAATLPAGEKDGLAELFPASGAILCGGQQRVCQVETTAVPAIDESLPASESVTGERVKWALLSPALFPKSSGHPGGWLPGWVCPDSGKVHLPREKPGRNPGESRRRWRKRIKAAQEEKPLDVRLVAAAIGKPEILTGWSDALPVVNHGDGDTKTSAGGKATRLAVPAGSVYYFEGPDAPVLARLVSWDGDPSGSVVTRSGALGEKGLGLGVCGPWDFYDSDTAD
ncbi:MAG: type III-B CRISPR module-associated Cmr3 family protein [Verrucomicrobiales bacterium]